MTQRIKIGSDDSGHAAPGDELSTTYYQEGDRLLTEHWGRIREEDPNEVISELFLNQHALRNCTDPVDVSRRGKYDSLAQEIISRFHLQRWEATYSDRSPCKVYATDQDAACAKASRLGTLESLRLS